MHFIVQDLNQKILISIITTLFFIFYQGTYFVKNLKPVLDASDSPEIDEITVKAMSKYLKKLYISFFIVIISSIIVPKIIDIKMIEVLKYSIFGFGMSLMLVSSYLDLKFGDLYMFQMEMTTTLSLTILPIILSIISKNYIMVTLIILSLIPYIIMKIVNYKYNSEKSIGGADIEFIIALILSNIIIFMSMRGIEQVPIFAQTFYFEKILMSIFINFTISIVIYFISKIKFKTEKNNIEDMKLKEYESSTDFKFLPALIMPYALTLFFLVSYI